MSAVYAVVVEAVPPFITNVFAAQRVGTNLMDVSYSFGNPDSMTVTISMRVSTNAGVTFNAQCPSTSGDIGAGVTTGENKLIVWNVGADLPDIATTQMCVRIVDGDGLPAIEGMALIPAGAFTMGNCMVEGASDELPVHTVMVSAFYMDKHEVTYTLWSNVHAWAIANGYSFANAGAGKATNHPVHTVNWYDCVKWCNARSEMEGRPPCYYTSTNFIAANIYKTGSVNLPNDWVNWTTNGYRLPTEAEWEKAARGGLSGRRFPWQDLNITHTNANYYSDFSYTYDTSATRGFHPSFTNAPMPYTSPVGSFAPNGYGLYDMTGNVWEWTWDWYDDMWYGSAGATQNDTLGPVSGPARVWRGGSWDNYAYRIRVAYRDCTSPDHADYYNGFRSVRR